MPADRTWRTVGALIGILTAVGAAAFGVLFLVVYLLTR